MALVPPGEFPSHFLIRSLSKCLENCPGAPGQFASHFFISLGNNAWNACQCYLEGFIGLSGSMCSIDFIWTYNIQTFDATLGAHSVSIALGKHLKLKGQHAQHQWALRGYSWLWLLYWLWKQYSRSLWTRRPRPLNFKLPEPFYGQGVWALWRLGAFGSDCL